ncbi:MAG: glycosyltransferase family 4 protein [Immundisolibacter sp.]|uniref:glycosyltransferase family 4 protein n=1 Tax=Immundisolibacter sp. TaxID=1934948 RepID=UPI003EE06ACD
MPHKPFRLLFAGNWNRRKGADLLPVIMQKLEPAFDLWTTAGLRGRHIKEHLPANIHFLGRVGSTEELVRLYQDCDALLFPSRLEGFGLVALEAQACGLPVIATNGSSIPEVVKDGTTGVLCPLDDIGCFVAAIEKVARDAELRAQLQYGAHKYVIDQFDQNSTVPRYIKCYARTLAARVAQDTAEIPNANF